MAAKQKKKKKKKTKLNPINLIYMYKEDLALNNLQMLTHH